MFQIGDKVVHPMYGAGVVESIVRKTVDNVARDYYILQLPNRSMVVMDHLIPDLEHLLPHFLSSDSRLFPVLSI